MASFIGTFEVHQLEGLPERFLPQYQVRTRAGVDGVAVWNVGEWGRPFRIRTFQPTANLAFAQALYERYLLLVGSLVTIVHGGRLQPNIYFLVLEVRPLRIRQGLSGKQSGNTNNLAGRCTCEWTLLPINPLQLLTGEDS